MIRNLKAKRKPNLFLLCFRSNLNNHCKKLLPNCRFYQELRERYRQAWCKQLNSWLKVRFSSLLKRLLMQSRKKELSLWNTMCFLMCFRNPNEHGSEGKSFQHKNYLKPHHHNCRNFCNSGVGLCVAVACVKVLGEAGKCDCCKENCK